MKLLEGVWIGVGISPQDIILYLYKAATVSSIDRKEEGDSFIAPVEAVQYKERRVAKRPDEQTERNRDG